MIVHAWGQCEFFVWFFFFLSNSCTIHVQSWFIIIFFYHFEFCEPHSCVYLTLCNDGDDIAAIWFVLMTLCIMGSPSSQLGSRDVDAVEHRSQALTSVLQRRFFSRLSNHITTGRQLIHKMRGCQHTPVFLKCIRNMRFFSFCTFYKARICMLCFLAFEYRLVFCFCFVLFIYCYVFYRSSFVLFYLFDVQAAFALWLSFKCAI